MAPPCKALAEVLADEGLSAESELVSLNDRRPVFAAAVRGGLEELRRSQKRAVLRLCVAAWEADDADADRRITACLTELGGMGCVACAVGALAGDGWCEEHDDGEGGPR